MKSITFTNSNENGRVEIAALRAPWPDWLRVSYLDMRTAVVDVADPVLSSEVSNSLPPEDMCELIYTSMGPETRVHAWLTADMDYQEALLQELGPEAIRAFFPYPRDCYGLGDASELMTILTAKDLPELSFGVVAVDCTVTELLRVGLPGTFLTAMGWQDRIGIAPKQGIEMSEKRCPRREEMLQSYCIVIVPGGEHSSECLFTSLSMGNAELLGRLEGAASSLDWEFKCLGNVEGPIYEELYGRSERQIYR